MLIVMYASLTDYVLWSEELKLERGDTKINQARFSLVSNKANQHVHSEGFARGDEDDRLVCMHDNYESI